TKPGETRHLLSSFDRLTRKKLFISQIRQCLAVDFFGDLGQRRILRSGVSPAQVQNRIGKLATLLLIKLAYFQKDSRKDLLIDFGSSWRWDRDVLPLQPAGGVDECAVFLGETRAWQTIDRSIDILHLIFRNARGLPEFRCLFRIE